MEPSDDPILRVNCDQTALVLGGSASAPVPPCSFFAAYDDSVPLHGEIVEQLASIIAPALCPSNILPRIKFSTFLYGPSGYRNITAVSSFSLFTTRLWTESFSKTNAGGAGCGKRTVVRHVAKHLGMHVVECCCHDLMTSSESGASAALVAAFKEAQKYSFFLSFPCCYVQLKLIPVLVGKLFSLVCFTFPGGDVYLVSFFIQYSFWRYSPCIILLRHFDAIGNTSSSEGPQSEQSGIAANVESVIKQYTGQRWVVKDSLPARDVIGNSVSLCSPSFYVLTSSYDIKSSLCQVSYQPTFLFSVPCGTWMCKLA